MDRGEALIRTRGRILALAVAVSLVSVVFLPMGGDRAGDADALVTLFLLEVAVLSALLPAGLVSAELRRGISLLWLQRGGSMSLYYLGRLAETLLLILVLSMAVVGLQGLVLFLLGGDALRFLAAAAPAVPCVILLVAVPVFALSCSGLQGEGWAGLVLLALWVAAPALLPTVGAAAVVARALDATAPPVGIVAALREWGLAVGAPSPGEVLGFAAWVMAVLLGGVLLLRSRLRAPFPSEQSR